LRGKCEALSPSISLRKKRGKVIESVIEVSNLRKSYGKIEALRGISFEVKRGEIFTFIGPNGAGKTTTLEIIEGLRKKDSGKVRVFGEDIEKGISRIKPRIGVQLQYGALYERLTVKEILGLFASFYKKKIDTDAILEKVALKEISYKWTEALSGGQLQRLRIATTLVNDPDLVFLDEPTTGLDPQSRRYIWSLIENLRKEGKTVLLTTHYMEEAEKLADRVAIIDKGTILATGNPGYLIDRYGGEAAMYLRVIEKGKDKEYRMNLKNSGFEAPQILRDFANRGIAVKYVEIKSPTLEDVFINLTGKELRE